MTLKPNIEIKYSQLPWLDPSREIKPTAIVLHWWGEPINEKGVGWLVEILGRQELSVQFSVLSKGDVYQLSQKPNTWCRHAKCANDSAIGIEIEGLGEKDLDSNDVQFQAVVELVRFLRDEYAIPLQFRVEGKGDDKTIRFFGITNHKTVDPYCSNPNGKIDVHDHYVERVIAAL